MPLAMASLSSGLSVSVQIELLEPSTQPLLSQQCPSALYIILWLLLTSPSAAAAGVLW